jgi:alanine dehydrogenase
VWNRGPKTKTAQQFCAWVKEECGLDVSVFQEIDAVSTGVDILVTTTPSKKPLVNVVSPGTHINAIGADAVGKQEIGPRIMKKAKIFVDDWTQASHSGEINVPLKKRQISRKHIYGELAEVVTGKKRGRISDSEITLFDSTGLAIQDIACAAMVYHAIKIQDAQKTVNFF